MRRHAVPLTTACAGAAFAIAVGFLATTSPRVAVMLTLFSVVAVRFFCRSKAFTCREASSIRAEIFDRMASADSTS